MGVCWCLLGAADTAAGRHTIRKAYTERNRKIWKELRGFFRALSILKETKEERFAPFSNFYTLGGSG